MIDGAPSRSMCRHLHQLEVYKLLQCGDQVLYPKGLNGGLELVLTSVSESLVQGMNMLGKPAHETSPGSHQETQYAWGLSSPQNLNTNFPSHYGMSPKAGSHISMTTEVQELLYHVILDTSSQALEDSIPKRPTFVALWAPPSTTAEDSSKPAAASTQASPWVAMPDNTMPVSQTPKVANTPATPPTRTPGTDMGTFPKEVILLQGEMNRAVVCLLMTRVSIDTHWRKQVWDFEMVIHQNEAKATEAIREMKAHCGAAF